MRPSQSVDEEAHAAEEDQESLFYKSGKKDRSKHVADAN